MFTAPFTLGIQDVPVPVIGPADVLVKIKAVGICGSDVQGYAGRSGRREPPLVMGHEASGVVASVGSEVRNVSVGNAVCFDSTVYCNACSACASRQHNRCAQRMVLGVGYEGAKRHGAMAEFVALPSWTLHQKPASLSFEAAALLEPLSIGMHAAARAGPVSGKTILIIGAGTIGQCTLLAVRAREPHAIVVVDLSAARLTLAKSMGAARAVLPQEASAAIKQIAPAGADICFEAVGIPDALHAAIRDIRTGGRIVLLGNSTQMPQVDVQQVVAKELTLVGSYASAGEYADALDAVSNGVIDPSPLISGVYPLEAGAECFARLYRGDDRLLKTILVP